ncbi:MAG: SRPBCC family protein [Acidimicrobiales bacterium]
MAQLEREIVVDATPSTIFPFLSEREQLLKWIGTDAEIDARPGGLFKVLVGGKHPSLGEFVEVVPDQKVAFTFGWDEPGHPIPAASTRIEISLIPEGDKTRVRLVHSGLPADAVADHTQGWEHYLDRLATAVGGDDPGPDVIPE